MRSFLKIGVISVGMSSGRVWDGVPGVNKAAEKFESSSSQKLMNESCLLDVGDDTAIDELQECGNVGLGRRFVWTESVCTCTSAFR